MDIHCPARRKDDERAKAAYRSRPARFETQRTSLGLSQAYSQCPDKSRPLLSQDSEGFITISKKRKVRGRPPTVATADTSKIASMTTFLSIPSTQFSSGVPSTLQPTSPITVIDNFQDEQMADLPINE